MYGEGVMVRCALFRSHTSIFLACNFVSASKRPEIKQFSQVYEERTPGFYLLLIVLRNRYEQLLLDTKAAYGKFLS